MAQNVEYLAEYQELLRLAGSEGSYAGYSISPVPEEHMVDFSEPSGLTPMTLHFSGK